MVDLKNYIYVTVIMLCFVFYGASAVGGNCCCGGKRPNYCILCMEEIPKKEIFCDECGALCVEIKEEIETPYYRQVSDISPDVIEVPVVSKVVEKADIHTPLISRYESKHFSPMVKLTAEPRSIRCLSRWLTDAGIERIIAYFVTGRKECTQEALMEFISGNLPRRIEKRSAFAQTSMVGFHIMAIYRKITTRPIKRMSSALLSDTWYGRLTDLTYRSFLVRIRLQTGKRESVDPKILTTWETGHIPEDGYEATLIKIMYESALGWPVFLTLQQAAAYKNFMPPTHKIMAIFKEHVSEAVGYMVSVHPEGEGIVILDY